MPIYGRSGHFRSQMVSIVVVGPPMSGKTSLCLYLAGKPAPVGETCCASYLSIAVNNREWHVWDTPRASASDIQGPHWVAKDILKEADIVLVCHDAQPGSNPMNYVRSCGPHRCIIVLTRNHAERDMSYYLDYLQTEAGPGRLVPVVHGGGTNIMGIVRAIHNKATSLPPEDLLQYDVIEI